jgi:endonuclease/exonuclease/phosphatase family metal-dependent hydrolase
MKDRALRFHVGVVLLLLGVASAPARVDSAPVDGPGGVPLRYLALNVGKFGINFFCWENKLCREGDVQDLRDYITTWQPDVIMLSEVMREAQLTGTENFGPILPDGYAGKCGESRDAETGELVAWDAANASHEHECVAWKTSRLSYVAGSALSAYGRNDTYGKANCAYDRTGFRARLLLDGVSTITAVAVHPHTSADCRTEEISRYWSELVGEDTAVIIGGDFNTESDAELQVPARFQTNYSRGQHWDIATHDGEYTAVYGGFGRQIDHAFSSFGVPCVNCGASSGRLPGPRIRPALGGYDDHPRGRRRPSTRKIWSTWRFRPWISSSRSTRPGACGTTSRA